MLWTIFYTIIDTIFHVHEQGIVHRDINLGSFVLAKPGDESSITLTGFGEACSISKGPVTTPIRWYADRFVAPEIVKKEPHGAVRFCVRRTGTVFKTKALRNGVHHQRHQQQSVLEHNLSRRYVLRGGFNEVLFWVMAKRGYTPKV